MAWRVCIIPGCPKTKQIQPFNTNTKHRWLCYRCRMSTIATRKEQEERKQTVKRSLAGIMNGH